MIKVKFKKLDTNAIPFSYLREGDACMDMYSLADDIIYPRGTVIIPTGIAVEIPEGYEGIVRGRSGLTSKGIQAHLGTIDSAYRGDVGIIITNTSNTPFEVKAGMRLAQFTVKPVHKVCLVEQTELTNTERGISGFGSSGL